MSSSFKLLMFVAVLLLSVPWAQAALITYTGNHNVYVGFPYSFIVQINNTESNLIYNCGFDALEGFVFPIFPVINGSSSVSAPIYYTATSTGEKIFQTKFKYQTLNMTISEPTVRLVTFNSTSISDNNVSSLFADTVRWGNTDVVPLTIRASDSSYEYNILPGAYVDRTFPGIGMYQYVVVESGFLGFVNVASNVVTSFLHDPAKDTTLTFNMLVTNANTDITLQAPVGSFNLAFNESRQGVLQLLSNLSVIKIHLNASKWITFSENDFNFTTQKIVLFTINPVVNLTNETGITHQIVISAKGSNTGTSSTGISVFIQPQNFTEALLGLNTTTLVYASDTILAAFCKDHPENCPTRNLTQIVYINRTDDEQAIMLRDISDKLDRTQNRITGVEQKISTVDSSVEAVSSTANRTKAILDQQEALRIKQEKSASVANFFKILGSILVVFFGGLALVIFVFKKTAMKMGGESL